MRMRIFRGLAPLLLFFCAACAPHGPEFYPLVAAHRGDRQAGADNSRAAIESGIKREFPYLEIDVRYSKDKAMVLSHERNVDRAVFEGIAVADETPLKEMTLADLRSVPLKNGGGALLTIEDALQMAVHSKSSFLLDLKERDPIMLGRIVAAAVVLGVLPNIVVQCQSPEIARFVRQTYPLTRILARADNADEVAAYRDLRPEIVQIDSEWATPEVVNQIKANGSMVLIKAVDRPYDTERGWRMLKRQGADIVLTDYPESLSEVSGRGLSPNLSSSISNAR